MNTRIRRRNWAISEFKLLNLGSTPRLYSCQELDKSPGDLGEIPYLTIRTGLSEKPGKVIDMKNANNTWNAAWKMEKSEIRYIQTSDKQTNYKVKLTYCKLAGLVWPWDYTISSRPSARSGNLTGNGHTWKKELTSYWREGFKTKKAAITAIDREIANLVK